jgi:Nicotinamide mononucleotide transporter
MLKYYGIDWIIAVLLIINVWMVGSKIRSGWLVGAVACCFTTAFGFIIESYPQVIMNIIFIGLNLRGYYNWKEEAKC